MELEKVGLSPPTPNERIIHLIPKRNIETWVLCLTGEDVDEQSDYKQTKTITHQKVRVAARRLASLYSYHEWLASIKCLPSLLKAWGELERLD